MNKDTENRRQKQHRARPLLTLLILSASIGAASSFAAVPRPLVMSLSISSKSSRSDGVDVPIRPAFSSSSPSAPSVPKTFTSVPRDAAMISTYDTLAARAIERYTDEISTLRNGQLFVGIGGGPGSGKSTLSESVADRINDRLGPRSAVVIPMDGFHYTRAELRSIAESDGPNGSYDALLARRGAPWTFDAEGCVAAFKAAREEGKASLPVYSRAKSDPVPDGVRLDSRTSIVLLEGNYLLSWDDPAWEPLRDVFDETWYVACATMEDQRERLIGRHLENWTEEKTKMWGEGREGAAAKADANDVLNAAWIDHHSRHHADLFVESK